MADKKKMSVAEMLAAARKADGQGSSDAASEAAADEVTEPQSSEAAPPSEKPAAEAPKPKTKPGERPSVADILAMAKSSDAPGAAPSPATEKKPKAEPQPAAKKAAAKPSGKAAGKAAAGKSAPAERPTTASILAAARGGAKRGPVSKAEAGVTAPAESKAKPKRAAKAKPTMPQMPPKPGYAQPAKAAEPTPDKGRRFMMLGVLFGSALATGMTLLGTTIGLWCLALARFMFPNILTEPPSRFKVGFPADFAPGQVETKFKAQYGIWLVNGGYQGQQMIYALSTVCTHLGCTPNWLDAEQKFKCPCHGSGFYKDGVNFEGPAPRPLERYAVRVADDGQIEVDKSRKFQEEMGQWADTASFVPV